jgi:hypothetical protein
MNAEEVTNQLSRLREKLQRLRTFDVSPEQFGAISHKYQLGGSLAEVKLQNYEQQYGVEFPYEYRRFLMEVGHGGQDHSMVCFLLIARTLNSSTCLAVI